MRIAFKPLARLQALHAFRQGGIAALGVIVPEPTRSMLGGARTLARMVDGRLMLAWEADELDAPLVSLAGCSLLFGLRPADAGFDRYTEPPIADATKLPLYENRSSRQALDAPVAVRLLARGDAAPDAIVDAELALAAPWALLRLQVDASLYATPAELSISLAARSDTLRYYVVAQRFGEAEFDQVQVRRRRLRRRRRAPRDRSSTACLPPPSAPATWPPACSTRRAARASRCSSRRPPSTRRARGPAAAANCTATAMC